MRKVAGCVSSATLAPRSNLSYATIVQASNYTKFQIQESILFATLSIATPAWVPLPKGISKGRAYPFQHQILDPSDRSSYLFVENLGLSVSKTSPVRTSTHSSPEMLDEVGGMESLNSLQLRYHFQFYRVLEPAGPDVYVYCSSTVFPNAFGVLRRGLPFVC